MRYLALCPLLLTAACVEVPAALDRFTPSAGEEAAETPTAPEAPLSAIEGLDIPVTEADAINPETGEIVATALEESGETGGSPGAAPSNETLATLGDATQPGMWLETPLVSTVGPGRITSVDTGQSVEVELRPIDGPPTAGSRASLLALQGLGLSLTDVAPIRVEAF